MIINNFDVIKSMLSFKNEDHFYHLQILKRRKDSNEMTSNNRLIKTYYIESIKQFENLQEEIISICNFYNARAYINLNKKSYEKIAFESLKQIAEQICNKDYKNVKNIFNSVTGKHNVREDKKWIVDIDQKDLLFIEEIKSLVHSCKPYSTEFTLIETKNGYHLITKPFNIEEFRKNIQILLTLLKIAIHYYMYKIKQIKGKNK